MNSKQSSSEQFMLYLKSLGGSEADVTGPACALSDEDTVETVISRLRMEKYTHGSTYVDPSILQASAQVLVSRRAENNPVLDDDRVGHRPPGHFYESWAARPESRMLSPWSSSEAPS
jgi:hypothetical protein